MVNKIITKTKSDVEKEQIETIKQKLKDDEIKTCPECGMITKKFYKDKEIYVKHVPYDLHDNRDNLYNKIIQCTCENCGVEWKVVTEKYQYKREVE